MSTTNVEALKSSIRNGPWQLAGEFTVEGESGPVTLVIRRPPMKIAQKQLEELRAAGLVNEKNEPVSNEAGLELAARMFAPMVFLPKAIRPLFTPEELTDLPCFDALAAACMKAMGSTKQLVEEAKGNF
ncbi:MAG: hypothetical protein JXB05_24690 [Myxococcaceae bacterium]|nr:hypothetical protein [Myxococcaceae bacterium]